MSDGLKKLRALLHELFQLDDADLDFGIYRILRLRRQEVERFIEQDLVQRVERAFAPYESVERAAGEEANPVVVEHRKPVTMPVARATLEDDIFARLHDFFSRYYDRGDFLSRRNFRGSTYAVPYAGEEVKLHFANADQYYVKSSARHAHYDFDLAGGLSVRFEVVGGGEERDDTKALPGRERVYQLDATPYELQGKTRLVLRFVFRADPAPGHDEAWHLGRVAELLKTDRALMAWGNHLLTAPEDGARTLLEKHFERFRRSESFDYFVHKDLGGFLRRELDHYLKTEVMHLDDIESQGAPRVEEYLSKIKVLRALAGDIITFLAQVEEFQKRLWLKKKFVLQTRWCVSMQLVPRDLWPDVAANDAQREAWVRLFAIDTIAKDLAGTVGYSAPLTVEFLEQNPTLVLDTVHFPRDFTDRLLASFDDLDDRTLGTLFHAENFQALRLMQDRYRGRVKCVYIDPPYNTGTGDFLYKDCFQHSSWLAMMQDRIAEARETLTEGGVLLTSIDETERHRLHSLLASVYGEENFLGEIVWKNATDNNPTRIATEHEYVLAWAKDADLVEKAWKSTQSDAKDLLLLKYAELKASGLKAEAIQTALRELIKENSETVGELERYKFVDEGGVYAGSESVHNPHPGGYKYDVLHPEMGKPMRLPANGYRFPQETMRRELIEKDRLIYGPDENRIVKIKLYLDEYEESLRSVTSLDSRLGSYALNALFGNNSNTFRNPKPPQLLRRLISFVVSEPAIVCDFFAGSGTTAQAVLELRAHTKLAHRFVLTEQGGHFDTVLLPRVQKLMCSLDWKNGIPASRNGVVGVVQVIELESYDDTLDNLVMARPRDVAPLFDEERDFARDYVLRYMLENETRESRCLLGLTAFERPFSRVLRVTRDDVSIESPVDLVETFHWLLGMTVRTRRVDGAVRVSRGTLPDGAEAVVVWRDAAELDAAALEAWFEARLLPALDGVSVVYVNGDQQVERLRPENAGWRVERTDQTFLAKMFPVRTR